MVTFIFSSWSVYAAVAAGAVMFDHNAEFGAKGVLTAFLLSAVAAPCLTTWICAEALHAWRRRRLLTRGAGGRWWIRAVSGLSVGAVGLLLSTVLLALMDSVLPDAAPMALGATISTLGAFALLSRCRRGRCTRCQYDLSGMTVAAGGVCPECGSHVMLAA